METSFESLQIPDKKQARRAASLCAFSSVALFLLSYGLMILYWILTASMDMTETMRTNLDMIVNILATDLFAMPLAFLIFLFRLPKNEALAPDAPDRMPFRMKTFLFFLPCAYAVMIAGSLTGKLIGGVFGGFNDVITDEMSDVHPLVALLCAGIVAPIAEELFFRKALIDRLSGFHPMDAIVFSALLFGFIHGNVTQFLYAFPLGVLLGIVYWRTKNIRYTIALHMALNLLGGVLPLLLGSLQPESEALQYVVQALQTAVFGSVMIGLVVVGIVFLIRYRRRFLPIESPLPRVRSAFYLNVGWFVALTAFVGLFVYVEFLA